MKSVKGAKKAAKKPGKTAAKSIAKGVKALAAVKKKVVKVVTKAETQAKAALEERARKISAQKDALIKKLMDDLAGKEKLLKESKKGLVDKAKENLLEMKSLAEAEAQRWKAEVEAKGKSLLEVKSRAEGEAKRLRDQLDEKIQALRGKMTELDEYKKAAEGKLFELEAKGKEYAAKFGVIGKERTGLVTVRGNPLTLLGPEIKVGDRAPDFRVLDGAMKIVTLDAFRGRFKIISSVPSLDTPVCDAETHRFNEEAGKLPENVAVLTISMDLPFAQNRWCAAAGVEKVRTFSDYRDRSFGQAYGVAIKETGLLARAIFIVDDQNIVRYVELVPELTKEPEYDRILSTVRALL
jgi:thioredoxin-dependent peroxiredoxin